MDSKTDKLRFSPTSNLACSTRRPKTMKISNKGKRKCSKTCFGGRKKRIYKRKKFEKSFEADDWSVEDIDSPNISSPDLESEDPDFDSSAGFGSEFECIQNTPVPMQAPVPMRAPAKRLFSVITRNTFAREEQHPYKRQTKDKSDNENHESRSESTATTSRNTRTNKQLLK